MTNRLLVSASVYVSSGLSTPSKVIESTDIQNCFEGITTRDPDVSPDRTHTGRPP